MLKNSKLRVGDTYFVSYKDKAALAQSLFAPGGSASGFFEKRPSGVLFRLPCGAPFAFLVANQFSGNFFVTCSLANSTSGKIRYMFSISGADKNRLGLGRVVGWSAECAEAERVWIEACSSPATV